MAFYYNRLIRALLIKKTTYKYIFDIRFSIQFIIQMLACACVCVWECVCLKNLISSAMYRVFPKN